MEAIQSFFSAWWFIIVAVLLAVLYIANSTWIIGPTENGIVVRLGNPTRVIASGIHFNLFRGPYQIVRYTTRQYVLDFSEREAITKRGIYRDPDDSNAKPEQYEAARLKIDTTVYFRWPRASDQPVPGEEMHPLIKAFRAAPPPGFAKTLKDFFEDAVVSRVRAVAGEKTWREVIENREWLKDEVKRRLVEEDASPFKEAGITNITVIIEEIKLPDHLEDALTLPQEEELRMRGVKREAEAERSFIEQQGHAYRNIGAIGPLASLFALLTRRKTPMPKEISPQRKMSSKKEQE